MATDTPRLAETGMTPTEFAMLSMHGGDKLRFLQFPPDVYTTIGIGEGNLLERSWPPGIAKHGDYNGAYEFKFEGSPWGTFGDKEGVGGRRLMRDILNFLHARGWIVVTSLFHSRKPGAKDSVLLRHVEQAPPPADWFVVSLTRGDRLRLIHDASAGRASAASSWECPQDLRELMSGSASDDLARVAAALKQRVVELDYFQESRWNNDSFEFKLKGSPWQANGENTMKARRLLLRVAETMELFGWNTYTAFRQRSGSKDVPVQDTWYFIRPKDWVQGSPFNSRLPSMLG